MTGIDLRSINLMTGIMCLVMGIVLLGVGRSFPGNIKGLGLWGLGPLLGTLAAAIYGLDGKMPTGWATALGNPLSMVACALLYFGTQRFYDRPLHWRGWAGLGLGAWAGLAFFAIVEPDYRLRVALFTGTLALLFGAHTHLLLRHGRGFAARFTTAVVALQTLIFSVRCAAVYWVDSADDNRFTANLIHTAYFISFSFMVLLFLVGVLLMASERVRAEFEELATYDSLTGALNRRVLQLAVEQELLRWQRYGETFAVLLLDIDHFKRINDQHGHQAGDRVLKRVVNAVRSPLRKTDVLGRYGGEEFLILLPVTNAETAQELAERVRAAVQDMSPSMADGVSATVSLGVSSVRAGDEHFDALIQRADQALYLAKAEGRNRVVMADTAA